jgi:hypothetical protein
VEVSFIGGANGGRRVRMVVGFQLPMQSVPITTIVVSSNPTRGEVYSIQHCDKSLIIDLQQVSGFIWIPSITKCLTYSPREM